MGDWINLDPHPLKHAKKSPNMAQYFSAFLQIVVDRFFSIPATNGADSLSLISSKYRLQTQPADFILWSSSM